ncbi:MAG TPA: flagellar hook assembly protein FlgD [Rhizomicrobium sp.]|nr:flagellar hook assembly protein FlgD [Rhizomicrobium sp.]
MTTIAPTTTATTAATSSSSTDSAMSQLSGNFDTFLQLLTTQLQNQDPMNPMDSDQFTQELVEFSGVEQQINTNDNLKSLIGLTQSNAGGAAVGYLGKTVTVTTGNAPLQDGEADWSYALGASSASTVLTVTDANGNIVYTQPGETGSGQHDFSWDGTETNGSDAPDGVYQLTVTALASDGSAVQSAVASKGVVSEVNLTGSEPMLMIGSMAVPLSQASAIDN